MIETCEDCGHAVHDGGATVGDCYCSVQILTGEGTRVCGCGYQTYESKGRCTKRTKADLFDGPAANGRVGEHSWGCHKPDGHDGYCSTHWECGHTDDSTCGHPPTITGGPCFAHSAGGNSDGA